MKESLRITDDSPTTCNDEIINYCTNFCSSQNIHLPKTYMGGICWVSNNSTLNNFMYNPYILVTLQYSSIQ